MNQDTSCVIVAFSGGKDSIVTLDLCARNFKRIEIFFMFWVLGLEFQEVLLRWAEQRYGVKIHRIPHFEIPRIMNLQLLSWYRPSSPEWRTVRIRELEDHVRRHFGNELQWIASGERKTDSLERRAMMTVSGQWDKARLHYYPIMEWRTSQVWKYIRLRHLPVPAEYSFLRRSWYGFVGRDLVQIKKHYPGDYRRILEVFPFVDAITRRYELYGTDQLPEVSHGDSQSIADSGRSLEPATN